MKNAGLILEGGGMRGVYTAGVLDYFMEQGLFFSHNYGVSAGAVMLCSYLSKQHRRSIKVYTRFCGDKRYCSVLSLLFTGDLFGAKFCYHDIPERLLPFDFDTYDTFEGKAYAVVTNVKDGKPEYLPMKEMHTVGIESVRASASMPLVSRMVRINGEKYLDGGMSDSIPIRRSISDGNVKNVVIMTKEVGYRREPSSIGWLLRLRYPFRRKLVDRMVNRHEEYNDTLDFIASEVEAGRAFLIQPKKKGNVSRVEKDPKKLKALYKEGYNDAKEIYPELMKFLEA